MALIRPMVFTGISGSHHLEWYPHVAQCDIERHTVLWRHLRENRIRANTYLNGLSRRDYREMFAAHFDIVEECEAQPGLGHRRMTPELRTKLAAYPDDELYSNNVPFVLRPKG